MNHTVKHLPLSSGYVLLQTSLGRQIRSPDLNPVLPAQVPGETSDLVASV